MYGESVCFMLGLSDELGNAVDNAVETLGVKTRPLRRLDETISNRLMTIGTGCVLVSEAAYPNSTTVLSSFFLTQRLWMPVVTLSEVALAKPKISKQFGAFAQVTTPIARDELAGVLQQALECDAAPPYSPAALRRKMLQLTRREKQTIELFLQGNNTKVVAKSLSVTHQTVDKHRGRALRKMGMRTVVDLLNALHRTMLQSIGVGLDTLSFLEGNEQGTTGAMIDFAGMLSTASAHTSVNSSASVG